MSESQPDLLVIGRISGCYGIKGWVKIHSFTEPVENMLAYDQFQLKRKSGLEAVEFDSIRRQGKGLVGHIEGVDDRNLAETYKGLEIAVGAEQLPTLDDGDFYWRELHGLKVWCLDQSVSEERVLLGTVDHLIDTGANDVLVVKACKESVDKQERLIPYLPDDVVTRVDLKAGLIEVDWFLEV
ncbi:MAG: 16S rRNA processing protein RimM [Halioglobus sp.]|jgi:16S rRNA processing protein RimM